MPMTDPQGNPIPEDDPRLPSLAATETLRLQAEKVQAMLEADGAVLGPLVDLEAKVNALEGLLVNPDPTSAVRRLYRHRYQAARMEVLGRIAKTVHEAQEEARKPKIEVASAIPREYRS